VRPPPPVLDTYRAGASRPKRRMHILIVAPAVWRTFWIGVTRTAESTVARRGVWDVAATGRTARSIKGGASVELNSLFDVLVDELTDLHSAEEQLVGALPDMAAAAHSYELRDAFEGHLAETVTHVERLQQAFVDLGLEVIPAGTCKAMRGLIQEATDLIKATGDPVAIDAALIGAAQRIEHHEIAGYGTARALAGELGFDRTSSLLDETLDEEGRANKSLTKLAAGGFLGSGINKLAATRTVVGVTDAADE
jgi:ferritin-like metal-binding protein YciE